MKGKVIDKYVVLISIPDEVYEILTDDELDELRDALVGVVMDIEEAVLGFFDRFKDVPGMDKLDVAVRQVEV